MKLMPTERQTDIILESELEFRTFKTEPPMTLPQEIQKRIDDDALQYAKAIPDCMPHIAYRRGATEWAGKAQPVIDLLDQIGNGPFPINQAELEEWLLKTKRDARAAFAKYKEVTNG